MTEPSKTKQFDLEERTYIFAEKCRNFVGKLTRTVANIEYGKQLLRSSGSQAANYIEANEAATKKDFVYRVRVCRKETKESCLWLRLCEIGDKQILKEEQKNLICDLDTLGSGESNFAVFLI
jgi:four helix bundle protein